MHRYLVAKDMHTSSTCTSQKFGHNAKATHTNIMGGNNFSKPKKWQVGAADTMLKSTH